MLYLGNILLRYVLIYNRSRSVFQFSLDIFTINCDENVVKTVFFLTSGYFLRGPDNSNSFRFPLEV